MPKNYVRAILLTGIDSGTFDGNYKAINPDGLPHSCSLVRITNDSNQDITISYNGTVDNDYLISGETLELNLQTNSSPQGKIAQLKMGTVVHVKAAVGAGIVYLSGYYS